MRHRCRPAYPLWLVLVLAAFSVTGCVKTNNGSLPINPLKPTTTSTTPVPTAPVTETFTGTLAAAGAASFPFNALGSGTVTATLTSLGPDSTVQVGFGLGYWTGTACTADPNFQVVASQGTALSATTPGAGTFCVGVYDTGNVQTTLPFVITVVHP